MSLFGKNIPVWGALCVAALAAAVSAAALAAALSSASAVNSYAESASDRVNAAASAVSEKKAACDSELGKVEEILEKAESVSAVFAVDSENAESVGNALDEMLAGVPTLSSLPFASVAEYGAKGSDGVDDTAALQSALDAAKTGGTVYFPAGEYLVSKTLLMYSNQCLFFENGAVLKLASDDCGAILSCGTTDNPAVNVDITGAVFDGGGRGFSGASLLDIPHAENVRVEDCVFRGLGGGDCVVVRAGMYIRFTGCAFESAPDAGCLLLTGGTGLGCRYCGIVSCVFKSGGGHPAIVSEGGPGNRGVSIRDNIFTCAAAVKLSDADDSFDICANSFFSTTADSAVDISGSKSARVSDNRYGE